MSRIIEGRFVLEGDVEKAKLREMLFKQAAISGVLTGALKRSNHSHVLLAVDHPENSRAQLDDEAVVKRSQNIDSSRARIDWSIATPE